MNILSRIVSETELKRPDGRPLYRYPLPPETFSELEEALRLQVASGRGIELSAPGFVLWAAEHIRSRFTGGSLSWAFVLDPLGLPSDDQDPVREIAKRGLSWWDREIKRSNAGIRMFLYSLVAEGGIPEALLKEAGLYRNVVMGLLAEIEAEGGSAAEAWAEQIASRWISRLPQTFQSADITRLLAGLALSLADLRALLPDDLPEAATTWATASATRAGTPERSMDEGAGERDTDMGTLLMLGFSTQHPTVSCGTERPHLPRSACRRDKSSPGMADCHETPFPAVRFDSEIALLQ